MKILINGLLSSTAMLVVILLLQFNILKGVDPIQLINEITGYKKIIVWVIYYIIGLIFSFIYAKGFIKLVRKINSSVIQGLLYGISVYVMVMLVIFSFYRKLIDKNNLSDISILLFVGTLIYGIVMAYESKAFNKSIE